MLDGYRFRIVKGGEDQLSVDHPGLAANGCKRLGQE
jgi:hypothetical protein